MLNIQWRCAHEEMKSTIVVIFNHLLHKPESLGPITLWKLRTPAYVAIHRTPLKNTPAPCAAPPWEIYQPYGSKGAIEACLSLRVLSYRSALDTLETVQHLWKSLWEFGIKEYIGPGSKGGILGYTSMQQSFSGYAEHFRNRLSELINCASSEAKAHIFINQSSTPILLGSHRA